MMAVSGLSYPPIFHPYITVLQRNDSFHSFAFTDAYKKLRQTVCEMFAEHYDGQKLVKVMPYMGEGVLENGFMALMRLKARILCRYLFSGLTTA